MSVDSPEFVLPKHLDEIDARFMTEALRASGHITSTNVVVTQEECGVGMTAGYFSAIKKVKCAYAEATDAQDSFVVKAWPPFEILPREAIEAMFVKDIKAYAFPQAGFYPRPKTHLAAFDHADNRWALIMEDADSFAEHKVHENEMTLAEVMSMLPKMVDVAVAWEGCQDGEKAARLEPLGVDFWASDANLAIYKAVMPGGAKLFDRFTASRNSTVVGDPTWDAYIGPGFAELFTRKIDAFFARARPENGATCTLSHGDLRGDNIFFCEKSADYPDGWLCIDFQLLFRGPVPSDLAYLMSSGSVLPEVYSGEGLSTVLRAFYDQFMARTSLYKSLHLRQVRRGVRHDDDGAHRLLRGHGRGLLAGWGAQRARHPHRARRPGRDRGRSHARGAAPAHVVAQGLRQLPLQPEDLRALRPAEDPARDAPRA